MNKIENIENLLKKIDNMEKMLWEDRKFFIDMMLKIDTVVKFVCDLTAIEDIIVDSNSIDDETTLKLIMESLKNDIEDKREEFIKYHQMVNSDQVGES